jgi:hypothetical protein
VDNLPRMNLINLFSFYLTMILVIGTMRRLRQYRDIVHLVTNMSGRWPRLFEQIKKHWWMFFTWSTFRPAVVAVGLLVAQMVCSRVIWPKAYFSMQDLVTEWWMLPVVGLAALAMLGVDLYFVVRVGRIDRAETERYLDEAEHWLTSWKAPMVRVLTFGLVNPRKIVAKEVQKALEDGRGLLTRNLWWISLQAFLRVLFGLTLWICWAVHPNLVLE